jgi:PDZ domain-containing protein
MFALGILDKLGKPSLTGGKYVAGTGEITAQGEVGPIGGIAQKTIGVRRSGVDVFLVPAGDNAEEAKRHAEGLRIVPVKTFQQALRALATLPAEA